MNYFVIKVIHIISASWLIGYLALNIFLTELLTEKAIKILDIVSLIALLLQPITGLAIIAIKPYNPMALWVIGSMVAYAILCCLWFSLLFFQYRSFFLLSKTQNSEISTQLLNYRKCRIYLISTCLLILIILYYFMTSRP